MKDFITYLSEDVFGLDHNTLATIVITLFVFFMGLTFQFLYTLLKNIRDRTNNRNIIYNMANKFIIDAKIQLKSFNKIISNFEIDNNSFNIEIKTIQFLEDLKNLDKFSFFNSFFTGLENISRICINDKTTKFNKILNHINTISYINNVYIEEYYKFLEKFNKIGDEWNEHIQLFINSYCNYQNNYNVGDYNDDETKFISKLSEIYYNWVKNDDYKKSSTNNHLLEPIKKLFSQTDLKVAGKFLNLTNQISNLNLDYKNLESLTTAKKITFNNYERRLRHSCMILSKLIKILKP